MANISAADVAAKWVQNIGAATQSIRNGVAAVTESPTASAARSADLWQQRVSAPAAKDKFVANLNRVSLEDWRTAMLSKGVNRVAAGAQASQQKFAAFMQQFLPFVQGVAQRVRQMPKATLEDRINRMVEQVRQTANFRRSA